MAMTLSQHLDLVYEITNRPDLIAESTSAVSRAVQQAHSPQGGSYNFDLQQQQIPYANAVSFQVNLPARYRRTISIGSMNPRIKVKEIPPGALFDKNFLGDIRNSFYVGGVTANFYVQDVFTSLDWTWVKRPILTDSYIAQTDDVYRIISYLASAKLFASLKQLELANKYEQMGMEARFELLQDYFFVE